VDWNWIEIWYLPGYSRCPHWTSVKCRSQKLDHITNSNAFIFHSCAFQFKSNVTVKWYTFHVYTLYKAFLFNLA
jgi:hypothetical protein